MTAALARRAVLLGAAASPLAARDDPRVAFDLPEGTIIAILHLRAAPLSAGDFLRYVDNGAYNGGQITRTVRPGNDHGRSPIAVIQGGIRSGFREGPPVPHETTRANSLRHLDGTLSLPRDAPGTATGAGFFICIGDQPALDFGGARNPDGQGFAAFGQVLSGMDIVRQIWRLPAGGTGDPYTAGQMLTPPVPIRRVRRLG